MTHQMLDGSWELDGSVATVGVYKDGDLSTLRYIQADLTTGQPQETLILFLGRVYDNSEGSLLSGDFRMMT